MATATTAVSAGSAKYGYAGGVVVQNAELEHEIVASASVHHGEARAWLEVHVEGREPELTELLEAMFD